MHRMSGDKTRYACALVRVYVPCLRKMRLAAGLIACAGAGFAACPGDNQLEMNECAHAAHLHADAELNALWPAVKSRADSIGTGPLLLDAQRKWIAFRDATCTAEAARYQGGSIQPLIRSSCLALQTERRVQDLRNMLRY